MDEKITLAHGAGGRQTAELIDSIFKKHLGNPDMTSDDAAVLDFSGQKLAFTTDGFIVSPYKFPGGNIGKLSVCGTVNDLSCMGAKPLYLSCAFVIEEGFEMSELDFIASEMKRTADEAGVHFAAGDTKVVGKGQADNIFITTTGIGKVKEGTSFSGSNAKAGDVVILTRDIGRHGCAVLLQRGDYGIEADVKSDCAPLWGAVNAMMCATPDIHVIRDATRGGVGTVLYEIAEQSGVGVELSRKDIPVNDGVKGVCGLLGLEPLYLACEGALVVIAPEESACDILAALKGRKYCDGAAVVGRITEENAGRVIIDTEIGSKTILPLPGGELLPRIC